MNYHSTTTRATPARKMWRLRLKFLLFSVAEPSFTLSSLSELNKWSYCKLALAAATESHMLELKLLCEDCSPHVHEPSGGHEIFVYSTSSLALLYEPVTPLQSRL